jgi:TolA-binding protein
LPLKTEKYTNASMANEIEKEKKSLIEDSEALRSEFNKVSDTVSENKNLITYALGALLLVAALFAAYRWYTSSQDTEAQAELFPLQARFEADSTKDLAKDFIKLADNYGSTKAGNLARFYAGVCSIKDAKWDVAIEQLEDFSSSDLLLQARAYSLIGDAQVEKKDYANAASAYKKAAEYKPNAQFTPIYLTKLALAQEASKDIEGAIASYNTIIEKYETSSEVINATKMKAKLEGAASE